MITQTDWSEIEVAIVKNKSKLITCKNIQPLKILNPGASYDSCHVVLSSYGGGMVSGDQIKLKVTCAPQSQLFLSSQSNTKIFKAIDDAPAEQIVHGEVGKGGLTVIFPDPVVLQENSLYRQTQHWNLHPEALLLVIDWFHSGRMDLGEQFQFTSFHSELKVKVAHKVILVDRFEFKPEEHIAASPANFEQYQTMFSAYLVGNPSDTRFIQLAEKLLSLQLPDRTALDFSITDRSFVLSVSKVKEGVYVLRAIAKTRMDLQPLCEEIMQELSQEAFFGYNPLRRKY